jgi:hypothetical protein
MQERSANHRSSPRRTCARTPHKNHAATISTISTAAAAMADWRPTGTAGSSYSGSYSGVPAFPHYGQRSASSASRASSAEATPKQREPPVSPYYQRLVAERSRQSGRASSSLSGRGSTPTTAPAAASRRGSTPGGACSSSSSAISSSRSAELLAGVIDRRPELRATAAVARTPGRPETPDAISNHGAMPSVAERRAVDEYQKACLTHSLRERAPGCGSDRFHYTPQR